MNEFESIFGAEYLFITSLSHVIICSYLVQTEKDLLNVHVFNPVEVFAEMCSCCLDQKCILFIIIKERHLYIHRKIFTVFLKTVKNVNVQPNESFPVYSIAICLLGDLYQHGCIYIHHSCVEMELHEIYLVPQQLLIFLISDIKISKIS